VPCLLSDFPCVARLEHSSGWSDNIAVMKSATLSCWLKPLGARAHPLLLFLFASPLLLVCPIEVLAEGLQVEDAASHWGEVGSGRMWEDGMPLAGLATVEFRQPLRRRMLAEAEPKPIKGPLKVVANCPKCKVQKIPDMCRFQAGREPVGLRWEDMMAAGEVAAAEGGEQGTSAAEAVAVGGEQEEAGGDGNTRRRGGLFGLTRRRRSIPADEADEAPKEARRRLLRARAPAAGKGGRGPAPNKGVKARQPVFISPSSKVEEYARSILRSWKANPHRCGMWTKNCVERYRDGDNLRLPIAFDNTTVLPRQHPLKKVLTKWQLPKNFVNLFPDLKPGDLGSCAVVAVGDNMLRQKRGPEIDSHDTVWRYNAPYKRFKMDVGRKADVMYWKMRKDEADYGQEGQSASKFYMWKEPGKFWEFGSQSDWETNTFKGKPLLWPNGVSMELWRVYAKYKEEVKSSATAAGGFKLALDVLASGLCKRIDLYGYTARGSGKYFKRESYMKPKHISGLEHWVYREAQAMGLMCVYD